MVRESFRIGNGAVLRLGWQGKAADKLPDLAMPRFDGIGANEFIVTTAHGVCDFISAVDTPAIWELNIWYHTLNCGMKTRISGETDFPCIYGDKVGLGRIYVKLPTDAPIDYDAWVQAVKDGHSYCGDGLSHLFDFAVNGFEAGATGPSKEPGKLEIKAPGKVRVTCDAAALLAEKPTPQTEAIRSRRLDDKPYWHLERARIGESRTVPVEVIVNGNAVATKSIPADGSLQKLEFDIELKQSSWIALRVLPRAIRTRSSSKSTVNRFVRAKPAPTGARRPLTSVGTQNSAPSAKRSDPQRGTPMIKREKSTRRSQRNRFRNNPMQRNHRDDCARDLSCGVGFQPAIQEWQAGSLPHARTILRF